MARVRGSMVMALVGLMVALPALAQPGGGGRGGGGRMSPEQILGLLAFEEKFNVTDEQLIKLRSSLKEVYGKQQEMVQAMRSGEADFSEMREKMMAMRGEMLAKTSAVLDDKQIEALKKHMQEMQSRRGRGGRGGQRGGPGGGADAD